MIYIEDVFPSFGHNTTHSLVRSYFLRPTRVILVFKVRRTCSWRIFLGIYGISLKEGLQLGFAHAFLHDM
jgi:hypothetical protein